VDDAMPRTGPNGGQLYESKLQVDARAMVPPAEARAAFVRRLRRMEEEQRGLADRNGHALVGQSITEEARRGYVVYTIAAEGFPKD
jgi:hypothetical protein